MSVELATAYISLIPSAVHLQSNIAKELAPVSGLAAAEGTKAGQQLGGQLTKGLAAADIGAGLERSTSRAAGTGERVLTRFAQRTGGLFQSLDRQLGNFGGPFTGNLTTIGTSLRTVAAGEKNVELGASELQRVGTAAYVGVGLAAVGFGAVSIKAALGAGQAHAQLDQAIQATKGSYEDYGKAIDSTVAKLAGFGFDQEEVDAALAKLTRATRDPAKALDLMGTAADIARARNLDLGSATQILVNIEAGRIRGLAQLGISTKDANGKTIDSETAVKRITALYGGAAAASAATYAGELQAVGATAHNLEEELGAKLLPAVADVGKGLLDGVHGFEDINRATGGWLGTLAGAAFVAGATAVAVTKISGGITKVIDLFKAQTVATEALTAAEAANIATTDTLAASQAVAAGGAVALVAGSAVSSVAPAQSAVREAELTVARSQLAAATAAATEAQVQFDAALLAGAGAEEGDLVAATALTEADTALALAKGEVVTATAAVTTAEEATTVAATTSTTAMEGEAATAGILGTQLKLLPGILAAVAIGFIAGKKAGDEINSVLSSGAVKTDELTAALIEAEKHKVDPFADIDVGKIASDLNHQIAGHGPIQFGKSLVDAVTGGDAHRAKADIAAINTALKSVLETEGVQAASTAYAQFSAEFVAAHGNISQLNNDLGPFFGALDIARAKADSTGDSVHNLGGSFTGLADSFAKDSAVLGIADQFQSAKDALDQVNQLKLDAVGQGEKSIQAAQAEEQAQQSLSDAYRSQASAASNLQDAKAKLAQFDSATDTRIRSLERQQIVGRVVTTPEEARQKEIDILSFDENATNQRRDLQKQIANAENGVRSATEGVQRAQQGVATAAQARRQIQIDAAQAIAGAERKAQEAVDGVAAAIQAAIKNQQLSNGQTQIYIGLLAQLEGQVAPNSPLAKNLTGLLKQMQLALIGKQALVGSLPIRGAVGPGGSAPILPRGTQPIAGPVGPSASGKTVDYHPTINVHGSDVPTAKQLDDINRKQGLRISIAAGRGG